MSHRHSVHVINHTILYSLCLQVMRSYFKRSDPFFDEEENHSLIGVANVFLACLFYDVKLQYAVPIINQKGEVGDQLKSHFSSHLWCCLLVLVVLL